MILWVQALGVLNMATPMSKHTFTQGFIHSLQKVFMCAYSSVPEGQEFIMAGNTAVKGGLDSRKRELGTHVLSSEQALKQKAETAN